MSGRGASMYLRRHWSVLGRVRPLLVFYLCAAVLFTAFRVIFLLHNQGSIRKVTSGELIGCFRVGWFYDTAVLCYFLAPAILIFLLVPRRWFNASRFRAAFSVVAAVVLSGFLLSCVSDLFFFDHYADRLNYLVFSYPLYQLEVVEMIWSAYPLGWASVLVLLMGVGYHMFFHKVAWPRGRRPEPPFRRSTVAFALVGLAVWGCLGPPHRPDSDLSPSYVCKEQVVNRASLNCLGTLTRALVDVFADTNVTPAEYGFTSPDEAFAIARRLLRQDGDSAAARPGNPLVRVSRPAAQLPAALPPPNVVVVVMESIGSQYVGSLGGPTPWTPELEALGRRGVMFDRFYAVGTRTSRGLVGILSGFPDLPGRPVAQSRLTRGPFLSVADILRGRGYHTMFIHGGNLKFNDVKRFIRRHGFRTVIDRADFDEHVRRSRHNPFGPPGEAAFTTFWSVDDQSLFLRANTMLREQTRPFFAIVLTLTNHPTYEVPHDIFDWTVRRDHPDLPLEMSEEERAVRYADWAVGDFFRRARNEPYFQNTLFVLVADHCRGQRKAYPVDAANFQIYAAMLGPTRLIGPPRRIRTVASQVDLAPTILARLGEPYRHCFFGRDVLTISPDDGFALLQQNASLGFVRGDRLMCLSPGVPGPAAEGFRLDGRQQIEWDGADRGEGQAGPSLTEMHRQGLALFQSAVELFQSGNYHIGQ